MNLATCRSVLLRHKIVMRFGCCLVAMSMIMSCWATPKAKAVATETALLGSIFGSLLVSMGYSWAVDNMDVPGFGEALYKLTQEYDETNKDTGLQLIRDLNIAALTAGRPGTIQFNYAWVQAARSFAEWFEAKFFLNTSTAVVTGGSFQFTAEGDRISVSYPSTATSKVNLYFGKGGTTDVIFYPTEPFTLSCHQNYSLLQGSSASFSISDVAVYIGNRSQKWSNGNTIWSASTSGVASDASIAITQEMIDAGARVQIYFKSEIAFSLTVGGVYPITNACSLSSDKTTSLSAEKPQEVHYPDVAEDGSQVYEITVDGVTATDIEGIIQGAVDQILAGTAAIAGEVAQAQDVPVEPEAPPELDGLDLPALGAALTTRFPFSIPWDVARGIEMLAAPAEAPYWEVDFLAPMGYRVGGWKGSTMVVLDFSQFEVIGQVTRWMSTIGFCLMLASSTKRLIWVA